MSAPAAPPVIELDEDTHTYRVRGRVVPSPTLILKDERWIDVSRFTDEARDRGKEVHQWLAALNLGFAAVADVPEEYRGYAESWATTLAAAGAVVLPEWVERRLFHEAFSYCTTLDVIVTMKGVPTLLEPKTGGPQDSYPLQTAAQAEAARAHFHGSPTLPRFGVHLKRDGSPARLVPHDDPNDWPDFLHALGSWWAKRRRGIS